MVASKAALVLRWLSVIILRLALQANLLQYGAATLQGRSRLRIGLVFCHLLEKLRGFFAGQFQAAECAGFNGHLRASLCLARIVA